MENYIEFWNEYNKYIVKKLADLLTQKRSFLRVDLHIHSKYSVDGFNGLYEKIKRAKENSFDIISITDHDSVDIYDELYSMISKKWIEDSPLIIPGVEYTVYYEKYNGLCHLLQYFINPKSEIVRDRLHTNKIAFAKRSKIQFDRIKSNAALQALFSENDIYVSYEDYMAFIKAEIPDYGNLILYLYTKLSAKGIDVARVKKEIYSMVDADTNIKRRDKYLLALKRFEKRHGNDILVDGKSTLLLPLLAPVGIDDEDYSDPPLGILTVNKYGQISLKDFNDMGLYVLAHPEVEQIDLLETDIPLNYPFIKAYEINKSNYRSSIEDIKEKAFITNKFYTVGSDSHNIEDGLYDMLEFYNCPKEQLLLFEKEASFLQ